MQNCLTTRGRRGIRPPRQDGELWQAAIGTLLSDRQIANDYDVDMTNLVSFSCLSRVLPSFCISGMTVYCLFSSTMEPCLLCCPLSDEIWPIITILVHPLGCRMSILFWVLPIPGTHDSDVAGHC